MNGSSPPSSGIIGAGYVMYGPRARNAMALVSGVLLALPFAIEV